MSYWNAPKAKVQLRLSIQRLRTLQQKKEAQAKASRRDIALLLERGKVETAKVKVETIINEDIHVELLELLELYCELLLARFGLLDQNTREPDPGVNEAVCSVIHAAPRTELKELHILRDILMHKYGREFSIAVMENRDGCVSDRVTRKLVVNTPSKELVEAYLNEIARSYGVAWSATPASTDVSKDDGVTESAVDVNPTSPSANDASKEPSIESTPKLPTPPPNPKDQVDKAKNAPSSHPSQSPPPEDEFEALAKRFADLKKR